MRPAPPYSLPAHRAIAAELVRVTLGGKPERPELLAPVLDDRTRHASKRRRRKR